MNRRAFLKLLGLCAVSPIALAKAASKIADIPKKEEQFKWVRPSQYEKYTWIEESDPIFDAQAAFAQAHARAVNRMKDKILLEALING